MLSFFKKRRKKKQLKKFLWHGYQCFVDPAIINQVILGDQPVDTEEVLSDIGEVLSVDVNITLEQ
jgi:hypothetical protein